MSHPIYARLSGFGWTLMPFAPFRLERVPHRPHLLLVEHRSASGPKRALLDFSDADPAVELGEGTNRLEEVLDFNEGPDWDHWKVETTVYAIRWPDAFTVRSSPEPPGFDLAGPNETLIFLQGPFDPERLPALEDMAGAGQTTLEIGPSWVELGYLRDGEPWRQTHRLIAFGSDVVVVTSQAPVQWNAFVHAAATAVAESLTPAEVD